MEKAAPTEGPKTATPALRVEEPEALGRRKRLAGKEGAASVQFEEVASTTSAVSERDVSEIGLGCNKGAPLRIDRTRILSGPIAASSTCK